MKLVALASLLLLTVNCKSKEPAPGAAPAAAAAAPAGATAATPPPAAQTAAAPPDAAAPAPSSSGAAPAGEQLYTVFGVKSDDVLNVRAEPSVSSKKVFSFGPSVKSIKATGQKVDKDKTPWMEVAFEGGTGWINRLYVVETHPGGGCSDPAFLATIRGFMRAVDSGDGAALQAVSSPLRGLLVRQSAANPSVSIAPADVATLFSSTTPHSWGTADGSGAPISGPFSKIALPSLKKAVTGKGHQESCGKLVMGGSAAMNNWPAELAALHYVSFNLPAADGNNDWVTWVAGLEYVDQKPYVAALVQYQWEI